MGDAWRGGYLIAQQPTFIQHCITRDMYEENGPSRLLASAFQTVFYVCSIKHHSMQMTSGQLFQS